LARHLGIDYGQRRIGLAISNPEQTIASPLGSLNGQDDPTADARALLPTIHENQIEVCVVGLPINMDGTEGPQAQKTRAFASKLAELSGLPVELSDERLTSYAADQVLDAVEATRKTRRRRRDALAAQVMLQAYLDFQSSRDSAEA
jgi:putative Holliday junction resolvase